MFENQTNIKTVKKIYPQIYAYILPDDIKKQGWIKIGYTTRKDVEKRIREQTNTAAGKLHYKTLWAEPALFINPEPKRERWFTDKTLHDYLRRFKNRKQWEYLNKAEQKEWFYYNGAPQKAHDDFEEFVQLKYNQAIKKEDYQLREEQLTAVNKTLDYIKTHGKGEFLWNAKPRFGKTLSTYDLVRKMDAKSVLVVTNRPAIANSWYDDFEEFVAWQTKYKFVSTSETVKNRPALTRNEFLDSLLADEEVRQISFISLQDLKGAISFGGGYDKLDWVSKIEWDLLVIDESHEGVDTLKTDVAFDQLKRKFTLYLSGTPFKALASGKFTSQQIFNWTYADEQERKKEWEKDNLERANPYQKLPKLNLFSYQMSRIVSDEVNKGAQIDGKNIDFAFDLNEFFATKENGALIHENDVKRWLDTLTQNEKYPFSTQKLRNELKHTFWLLNRVSSAKALGKLLGKHPIFCEYKIILAVGNLQGSTDEQLTNQKSFDRVKEAIKNNKKTITLSVGQLTTGVTIPEWSAVLMLSNLKSPSLYMQAAFRSQNPWVFELDGELSQKENAYVFDFAPERTLTIYDEFANNLSQQTTNGGGTTNNRKDNIRMLLNFFPVIAEDSEGEMKEIDVNQVLTIPKTIKANEVVKRGFMSNLLFQNVSRIFASEGAKEILEQLNPVDVGKTVPRQNKEKIDTQNVQINDQDEVIISNETILANAEARFGEKVYAEVIDQTKDILNTTNKNLTKSISDLFKENTQESIKKMAKENGLTIKQAEKIVDQSSNIIAREVDFVEKRVNIKKNQAEIDLKNQISEASYDDKAVKEAKNQYEKTQKKLDEELELNVLSTVKNKTKEITQKAAETILKKVEEKKKITIEDDIRSRLRSFARTIPSFLMAYGKEETTLNNFDKTIDDKVFKEVTGITLDQFRKLRDEYDFFDSVIFDESVQEFLRKRQELANYFDENIKEDIFDYIPPQQTNQIYTPKKVVKMMIDKLEEEDPDIFKDKNKTFSDLYMKSGLYITEVVKRLYKGLSDEIPDNQQRLKHILEKQVYGFAPTEIIYEISKHFIFGFDEEGGTIDQSHIVYLDTTPYSKRETGITLEEKCDELFGGKDNEI